MRLIATAFVTALAMVALCWTFVQPAASASSDDGHSDQDWIGTWEATPLPAPGLKNTLGVPLAFVDQTLRMIVQPHFAGDKVRIKLSNKYGTEPVTFSDAYVGHQGSGANELPGDLPASLAHLPGQLVGQLVGAPTLAGAVQGAGVVPGSNVPLSFDGDRSVTIAPGDSVYSDAADIPVAPGRNLTVSFYVPHLSGLATQHTIGNQVNYVGLGDSSSHTSDLGFVPDGISYYFLSALDVAADADDARTVVALGDSLTDGLMSTVNANHRYPDFLAQRLRDSDDQRDVSVVNEGVAGQRVLFDNIGPSALHSLRDNVIGRPGVKYVILQDGINDLANPPFLGPPGAHPERVSAQQLIEGFKQFIALAHEHGIKVYATTITPSGDLSRPARGLFETYSLPEVVKKRLEVNDWIRHSGAADAVIDFDEALRDPNSPNSIKPELASADNLHPNDAGYKVMAETVDLSLFDH